MTEHGIYENVDDISLASLLMKDDQQAFTELYNRYSPVLHLFILFYTRDAELTRDILQSVFLSLWEQRHKIAINTSVKNYLYTSAKNRVLNAIRSHKVHADYQSMLRRDNTGSIPSPEELYEREEIERLLELAIADLRHEKKQKIVELRRAGLSNKEIAKELGIPENTVRTYYLQSVKTMRNKFDKLFICIPILLTIL